MDGVRVRVRVRPSVRRMPCVAGLTTGGDGAVHGGHEGQGEGEGGGGWQLRRRELQPAGRRQKCAINF